MAAKLMACDNPLEWRAYLTIYNTVLDCKAKKEKKKDLVELDNWFQNKLPQDIERRSPPHVTKEELVKLMKWKLMRGKFRPRLTDLVAANKEDEVIQTSMRSFSQSSNIGKAIKEMTALKGVGPATASAILCAKWPEHYAFMADEAVSAVQKGSIQYNLNTYLSFNSDIEAKSEQLNSKDRVKDWTPHKVELCLWTENVANKFQIPVRDVDNEGPSKKLGEQQNETHRERKRRKINDKS